MEAQQMVLNPPLIVFKSPSLDVSTASEPLQKWIYKMKTIIGDTFHLDLPEVWSCEVS